MFFFSFINLHYYVHSEIRNLVNENRKKDFFWIGLNDRAEEGNFRLMNGTFYKVKKGSLYYWRWDEPNNSGVDDVQEDCVQIRHVGSKPGLNDADCDEEFYGLCEIPKRE